jgi:hypothetical protein
LPVCSGSASRRRKLGRSLRTNWSSSISSV